LPTKYLHSKNIVVIYENVQRVRNDFTFENMTFFHKKSSENERNPNNNLNSVNKIPCEYMLGSRVVV
jgi:hypothetical protein